ncbi:MAG: hypothetical protein NTV38_08505 [Chloroflexi bacterium]|nr:hypothetical protein [Chloroflexota bacterium]
MGWASGSQLAEDVWDVVRPAIPQKNRQELAVKIIRLFEDHDCDTLDEAQSLIKDADLPEYQQIDY